MNRIRIQKRLAQKFQSGEHGQRQPCLLKTNSRSGDMNQTNWLLKTGADAGLVAKEPVVLRWGMQAVSGRQQPYFWESSI